MSDILEYVAQIDFDKYFDAQGRGSGLGGKRNQEFVDFSASSVKATQVWAIWHAPMILARTSSAAHSCQNVRLRRFLDKGGCASWCRPNWRNFCACSQQTTCRQLGSKQHHPKWRRTSFRMSVNHNSVLDFMHNWFEGFQDGSLRHLNTLQTSRAG